ncbi:hypothetical protein B0T20DRAFT_458697 [Sordaria brevicollis]|uniref:Glycosyl transferase family 25 domain-containing protein n=1 Tax=Sordaria brevicollis TaxID=83679 RepID=A0AAE0UFH2_SORBR|nr:hypothetical protein B0T20DRAFT_458697 [Sordaria brevicollis]
MIASHRATVVVFFSIVAVILTIQSLRLHGVPAIRHVGNQLSSEGLADVLNSTLGFQKIFVINLPERTDRRDAMTLAAALTNLQITWAKGIRGSDVPDKVIPGEDWEKSILRGNKGSWRAHMNVLNTIVNQNLSSALILEDDADWDIRLKSQMQIFARAAQPFAQHFQLTSRLAAQDKVTNLPITSLLPSPDLSTPYGSKWDVLWLGHCGTNLPTPNTLNTLPTNTSLLRVVIPDDPTVPRPEHLKPHPFALQDHLAELYPPHTRVVHPSSGTICTQAYAVSQQGARKLLWRFGVKEALTKGWDLVLGEWCDGLYFERSEKEQRERQWKGNEGKHKEGKGRWEDKEQQPPVCVTVQPPLFSHHYGKGAASDITAPGGGFVNKEKEMTPYVRWSVRLNMGRLVEGGEVRDQWPGDD